MTQAPKHNKKDRTRVKLILMLKCGYTDKTIKHKYNVNLADKTNIGMSTPVQ